MATLEFHLSQLQKSCRVCGDHGVTTSYSFDCSTPHVAEKLYITFGLQLEKDDNDVHPKKLCLNCFVKCTKTEKQLDYSCATVPVIWQPHQVTNGCATCQMFLNRSIGGRKRKLSKGRGRPPKSKMCANTHTNEVEISSEIIPPVLLDPIPRIERFINLSDELICPICREVLDRPVQTLCNHYYCSVCISSWLECAASECAACPVCKEGISPRTLMKPPRLLLNMLASARVACAVCKLPIQLEQLVLHESICSYYITERSTTLVSDILRKSKATPLSPTEETLVTHLMRRKLITTASTSVFLRTGELEWSLKVFLFGDYAFLCAIYGISGASGKHCCLWCLITQDELKMPLHVRGLKPTRTLQGIIEDNNRFQAAGSSLSKAKLFHNAIRSPMFNIPINQVCPPALHISMCIFNRLFLLLVQALHLLDIQVAHSIAKEEEKFVSEEFQLYIQQRQNANKMELEAQTIHQRAEDCETAGTFLLLRDGNDVQGEELLIEANKLRDQALNLEKEVNANRSSKLVEGDGPCVKRLGGVLKEIGAERQAYHGGSFNGNHTNKCLLEKNIDLLVQVPVAVCSHLSQEVIKELAKATQNTFKETLGSFGVCHRLYSQKGKLSEGQITKLDTEIKLFLYKYKKSFPGASVLPKMHILENHVMKWIKQHKGAIGLLGEQGVESIHHEVNDLLRSYNNIRNTNDRLKSIMEEHHRRCHPQNASKVPPIKRRRKCVSEE